MKFQQFNSSLGMLEDQDEKKPVLYFANADIDHCFNLDLISAYAVDTFP